MSLSPFVAALVKEIVSSPDEVSVEEFQDRGDTVFQVTVSPEDVGRIIGRDGRVISRVRYVVAGVGQKSKLRTKVKIVAD